jgi:putative peptidoglycan lipid II flippase
MIGVITVAARAVGFGRQVVFAHTVGTTCLGTAYTTANMVPNIIFDIVLGGALSSVVVPVLAGPVAAGGGRPGEEGAASIGTAGLPGAQVGQIARALLTWTVLLLVPVSVLLAVAARPIITTMLSGASGCPHSSLAGVGTRMLIVFAPQVLLYGLAVVLYGILQARRRFGAPALAPLLSSLVVVGAYLGFGAIGGQYVNRLGALPPLPEYLLSGGTTLGVLALVVTALVPAWRLRQASGPERGTGGLTRDFARGLRPTLRFPSGVGSRVRKLALAGVLTLVAQDASVAVVIVLANRFGHSGALVLYGFAWAVFVVPFAVLAVPIATSAFPELSALTRGAGPEGPPGQFDVTAAASTRAVLLASMLGAAALAGARTPLARVFESHSAPSAWVLATSLAAFAPGLIGYGLSANLTRVLYALGRNRAPALAVTAGWLLVIVVDASVVPFLQKARVVPVLALGTTIGLTAAGIALLVLVRRERGTAPLAGMWRAFGAGTAGCVLAAAAGSGVAEAVRVSGFFPNVGVSLLVSAVVTAVFGAVVVNLDGGDARAALSRLRGPRLSR